MLIRIGTEKDSSPGRPESISNKGLRQQGFAVKFKAGRCDNSGWGWLEGGKVKDFLLSVDLCLKHSTHVALWADKKTTLLPRWSYTLIVTCDRGRLLRGLGFFIYFIYYFFSRTAVNNTEEFSLVHSVLFDFFQKRHYDVEIIWLLPITAPPGPEHYEVPHTLILK